MIYSWYYESSPNHFNSHNRNQILKWTVADSEQKFNENLADPTQLKKLEKYHWLDANIDYSYNNHGFRSDPFDDRPAGLALGCSFTEGVGLHVHQTWPALVSKKLNLHLWNLGVGGASLDTVFRLLDFYIDKFNPQTVFVLIPPSARFEYADKIGIFSVMNSRCDGSHGAFFKEWFGQPWNIEINKRKNLLAIQQLCQSKNIPLIVQDSQQNFCLETQDLARDLLHPGVNQQNLLADRFCRQYQKDI